MKHKPDYPIYHDTLGSAIDAIETWLDNNKASMIRPDWREVTAWEHCGYEQTIQYHFSLGTYKGKPTGRYLHATVYRLPSGRYELTLYCL